MKELMEELRPWVIEKLKKMAEDEDDPMRTWALEQLTTLVWHTAFME